MIFDGSKKLTKVFLWRNNEGLLESFQGFVQKNQFGQNAQGESEWFFSVAAAKLG